MICYIMVAYIINRLVMVLCFYNTIRLVIILYCNYVIIKSTIFSNHTARGAAAPPLGHYSIILYYNYNNYNNYNNCHHTARGAAAPQAAAPQAAWSLFNITLSSIIIIIIVIDNDNNNNCHIIQRSALPPGH